MLGAEHDPPLVIRIPKFSWQVEDNTRTGVFSHAEYEQLRDQPDQAHLALVIGYNVGLRRGAILSLRWEWVDLQEGLIRIAESEESGTKTSRGVFRSMATWGRISRWPALLQKRLG